MSSEVMQTSLEDCFLSRGRRRGRCSHSHLTLEDPTIRRETCLKQVSWVIIWENYLVGNHANPLK